MKSFGFILLLFLSEALCCQECSLDSIFIEDVSLGSIVQMKDPKSLLNAFEDTFDFEKQEDLLGDISFLRNDHLVLRYWDYFPDTSSLTTLELLTDSYALLLNGKSKELKLGSEFYVDLKSEIDALNECFEFINFIIKVDNQNLVTKIMITIRWT